MFMYENCRIVVGDRPLSARLKTWLIYAYMRYWASLSQYLMKMFKRHIWLCIHHGTCLGYLLAEWWPRSGFANLRYRQMSYKLPGLIRLGFEGGLFILLPFRVATVHIQDSQVVWRYWRYDVRAWLNWPSVRETRKTKIRRILWCNPE